MGFCVTNDKTGTGGIFQEVAAGKAPEQDHDQRYHRGLRGQPHDLLLPFKDIYDLVDWILAEDAAKAMEGRRGFGTWSEAYLDVLRQLQDNKTLVLNVYRSVGREQVEQYLYRLLDPILKDFADRECHDITVQDADKQFVVDFYKYALVGMTLEWTRRDMKGDPKKMVERVSTMIHGDFRRALCRLSSGSLKIEE